MATFTERLQIALGKQNKLNKALYVYYGNNTPIAPPRNYTQDLLAGYMQSEAIYSIVNKIAKTASVVPLEVVDSNNDVVSVDWAERLLQDANEDTTFKEMLFNYYVYLLSIGNSYIYSPSTITGQRAQLWNMPSDLVEVISGTWYEPIKGYKLLEGDQEITFEKKDVLHGRLFNPRFQNGSWVYGISPISVAVQMIEQIEQGSKRMMALAETGGPPFIISAQTPEGLTEQQQELLEDTYKKKYMGADNINKPMLSGTPLKVETMGFSAADLDLLKGSQYSWRVLATVYGVPSILFNDLEQSTYDNYRTAVEEFYHGTIMPLNQSFADKLSKFLFPENEYQVRFVYNNVKEIKDSVVESMGKVNGITFLTDNEKREMFGYDPINTINNE